MSPSGKKCIVIRLVGIIGIGARGGLPQTSLDRREPAAYRIDCRGIRSATNSESGIGSKGIRCGHWNVLLTYGTAKADPHCINYGWTENVGLFQADHRPFCG